jgi:hypothetical protein
MATFDENYGYCLICDNLFAINKDGTMHSHRRCPGSGKPPAETVAERKSRRIRESRLPHARRLLKTQSKAIPQELAEILDLILSHLEDEISPLGQKA